MQILSDEFSESICIRISVYLTQPAHRNHKEPEIHPTGIVFYSFTSSENDDFIYGLSSSYYVKNIAANSFDMAMNGKNGHYHKFTK